MDLHTLLRIAHILLLISIVIFIWSAWKVSLFKNKNSSFLFYLVVGIGITLLLSLLIHYLTHVKTKLGYYLRINDYPKYTIY